MKIVYILLILFLLPSLLWVVSNTWKSIFQRKIGEIDFDQMNRAIDYLSLIISSMGYDNKRKRWELFKDTVINQVDDGEQVRTMRADVAVSMLCEINPAYFALMDIEEKMSIEEREYYIFSIIVNELGYETE